MSNANTSGDSAELEALFDSVAATAPAAAPPVPPAPQPTKPAASGLMAEAAGLGEDSPDLEALFDSVSNQYTPTGGQAGSSESDEAAWSGQEKIFQQVGSMTRHLHDTLGDLSTDTRLKETVSELPDAKDRLSYVATLTEQAAFKVLNATDAANPIVEALEANAALLSEKWERLFANQMGVEEFKALAAETRSFLKGGLPQQTGLVKGHLMEIMMAQDFQDLTGQVIKKVVRVAQDLETQLMGVLIDAMPGEKRTETINSLLNGPVINANGATDVVVSQVQVDDLLESLGF